MPRSSPCARLPCDPATIAKKLTRAAYGKLFRVTFKLAACQVHSVFAGFLTNASAPSPYALALHSERDLNGHLRSCLRHLGAAALIPFSRTADEVLLC